MRFLWFISFMLLLAQAQAQQLSRDVRGMGMGEAGVALTGGSALFANPAGMAKVRQTNFLAGANSRFELAELTSVWLGATLPLSHGTFGLRLEAFGFDTWKQQRAALSYARSLFHQVRLAVGFSYLQNSIAGYGRQGRVSGGFGLQADLKKDLTLGVAVDNPFLIHFAEGDYLPTRFNAGLAWRVSDRLLVATQLDKTLDYELRFRSGFEYAPIEKLQVRFGFATGPAEYSGGAGLELSKGMCLEMAATYHQVLGFSPAVLFRYAMR